MLTIGSLFSGIIGGLELGLERSGLGRVSWQVEQDQFCQRVLEKHWPGVDRHDDVRTVGAANLAPVDLICGGFPCQDVSGAGKGAGLAGARSGLWSEFARLIDELCPKWVVVENVTSGASRWIDTVVRDLEKLGYATLPIPLSAEDVGAPHLRRRVFVIGTHSDCLGCSPLLPKAPNSRGKQRRGEQERGKHSEKTVTRYNGEQRISLPDAHRKRESQQERHVEEQRGWSRDCSRWTVEPGIRGVAHGIPSRAHRLRALGNAVVPQCAEVVGWVIRELVAGGAS